MNLNSFVINWHITEKCNYHCQFCFAKWNHLNEIWTNVGNVRKVLTNIANYHSDAYAFTAKRLNIVGGEPILQQKRLWQVIKIAYEMGFEISIITNGSHLENIKPFVCLLSQVGISIDSFDHETNMKIGREYNGNTISFSQLESKIAELKERNPNLKVKINTVVNAHNFNEILVDSMARLNIDKWKILRQLPFNGNEGISDLEFYTFLLHNLKEEKMPKKTSFNLGGFSQEQPHNIIFVEDNDVMTESYLMIAPDGRLFQNGNTKYQYSHSLTNVTLSEAISEIHFDPEKFKIRYNESATKKALQRMQEFFKMKASHR